MAAAAQNAEPGRCRKDRVAAPDGASPAAAKIAVTALSLVPAEFHAETPSGASSRRASSGDRTIAVEPVGPAIERAERIEVAHLGLQAGNLPARDVGRIGDDDVDRPLKRCPIIAGHE